MVKQKQTPISDGNWKDLRVRKDTRDALLMIKMELDLLTYDEAIQVLIRERRK